MTAKTGPVDGRGAAMKVKHFVGGAHRLAITSESLSDLLGLAEAECRIALEALAAGGMLQKVERDSGAPLYCKG
ncbi:MAG: hypothetical protein ACYC66_07150 [Chloroflexota bacterium]